MATRTASTYHGSGQETMKNRIFIVAPTKYEEELGDTLHIVCKTSDKDGLLAIYHEDRYEEIVRTGNMKSAVRMAKKYGAKRPAII